MPYFIAPVLWPARIGRAGGRRGSHDKKLVAMITPVPHELAIGGVYMPPLLVASALGVVAALATTRLLARYRLAHHFFYPPRVLLALIVIYSIVIGTFIIGA